MAAATTRATTMAGSSISPSGRAPGAIAAARPRMRHGVGSARTRPSSTTSRSLTRRTNPSTITATGTAGGGAAGGGDRGEGARAVVGRGGRDAPRGRAPPRLPVARDRRVAAGALRLVDAQPVQAAAARGRRTSPSRSGRGAFRVLPSSSKSPPSSAKLVVLKEPYTDTCLLYTSPSPRDRQKSRMPSSA